MTSIPVTIVAAAVLLAVAGRLASPVADGRFRRMFPLPTLVLATTVLSLISAAVFGAFLYPTALVGAALLVSTFVFRESWQVVRGRRTGEPPGDRGLVTWIRALAHQDAYASRFAEYGPVMVGRQFVRTVVLVEGIERGRRLINELHTAIGPSPLSFNNGVSGNFLRYMDDSNHDQYGPLFRRALSREISDSAGACAENLMRRELSSASESVLDPEPIVRRVVHAALVQVLLGLDSTEFTDSPDRTDLEFVQEFRRFADLPLHGFGSARTRRSLDSLEVMVRRLGERAKSHEAPVSVLRNLTLLDDSMPDRTVSDNLMYMLAIGSANTSALALWSLQHLGENPAMLDKMRSGSRGIISAVLNETLRLSQSEYVYRRVLHDTVFDGFTLREGWLVRICVAESHRDPEHFECPVHFTDRFVDERFPSTVFSPFGLDRHACNSANLALSVVARLLEVMVNDPNIVIEPSSSRRREFRHWSHWRPGADLRLRRASSTVHVL